MKFYLFIFLAAAAAAMPASAAETPPEIPLSTWQLPLVWPRHQMLRQRLMAALRRGDATQMEQVCRQGVKLIPGDATWHYNLACALAYRETPQAALDELSRAVDFGFRDAKAIEKDNDFARIRNEPRFAEIVERARKTAHVPVFGRPIPEPVMVPFGHTATLSETNLVWDFESGFFNAKIKLVGENAPSPLADRYSFSKPDSPERPYVSAWISEGTAAGNGGDIYMNRDRAHSTLNVSDFPLLTPVTLPPAAAQRNLDIDHPCILFPGRFAIVNASRARLNTPLWRSMARASMTEPGLAQRMHHAYMNNQIVFFPANKDFGIDGIGDIFPAAAPFQVVSKGASWSDQPFMRATLAATASFRRPAKEMILRRRLGGPTIQWLLRRTRKGVKSEDDYLSPKAHPTVFDAQSLDVKAMAELAHSLKPNEVPPAVAMAPVNSKLFPIRIPLPGRDYSDTMTEFLFATPSAIGIVLRGPDAERSFILNARTLPENDPEATFAWRVVHGPSSAVKISTPLGETLRGPAQGLAQIVIDRRDLKERIDVAVFAKSHGTEYGAPSIISFYPLPFEKRVYDGKRLVSIDNSNPEGVYCDPLVALPRRWKDVFRYAKDGTPLGFTRSYAGQDSAEFTSPNERIVEKNPDGSPKTLVRVKYLSRKTGERHAPFELTYIDDGAPYAAKN